MTNTKNCAIIATHQTKENTMDIWNANELIDNDVIDNLTDSQVDQLLDILKNI